MSSKANLHLSYNTAGRSLCRLQNHHEHNKHRHRGMGGALPTSQLILQPFRCFTNVRHFTYVTTHSSTLPPLHQRHSSLYNPSVASPTSQLILQPFSRFTYVTSHSTTLLSLHLRHRHFTYANRPCIGDEKTDCGGLAFYSKLLSLEEATV